MSEQVQIPLRVTTDLVVMLGPKGVHMVNGNAAEPLLLNYHDLLAISELHATEHFDLDTVVASVAKRAGVDEQIVRKFIRSLTLFYRLRRRKNAVPSIELPASSIAATRDTTALESSLVALKVPLALRLHKGDYQLVDHDGCLVVSLGVAEVIAVSQFVRPIDFASGCSNQQAVLGDNAIDENLLKDILARLAAAGLVVPVSAETTDAAPVLERLSRAQSKKYIFSNFAAEQEKAESHRQQQTGTVRPKVIPVALDESIPAALGLMFSYAKAYENGCLDDFYDFRLDWFWDEDRIEGYTAAPAIYLYSNYLWTHEQSIAASQKIKQLSPDSITIHGGPDTPKYPRDAEKYFADYPHVDIIVRGEGEASCAETLSKLRSVIGHKNPDLSVLRDVAGITYRHNGKIFRTPDRERISDMDCIPSPYLTGLFDAFIGVPRMHVTLETNRGCPYGCTFCDWGSATSSKIRKLDLERIFDELEWCSAAKIQSVSVADANFGVFPRDVSIAQKVGDLKRQTGYPQAFGGSFAKNSTKHLQKIIRVMAEADIWTQGVLSLQTMDDDTLKTIKRSNIKVEKYDALANEMRNANLQLSVELMMALPGSTLQSFVDDLQQCMDRDIQARINHTTLLVNSPMNAPEYLAEHKIKTGAALGPGKTPYIESTSTFSKEDLDEMLVIRDLYILLDNFGVLRLCSRFVRQQTGIQEMAFIQKLHSVMSEEREEKNWPVLSTLINSGRFMMAPPYSWGLMIEELRRFLVTQLGIADDTALDALVRAQHALLPSFDRRYPQTLELQHDVVAWHSQMLRAKEAGHWQDWHTVIPPLVDFGPGKMHIDDPDGFVTSMLGCNIAASGIGVNWDMDSGIGRARVSQDFESAWLPENTDLIQTG